MSIRLPQMSYLLLILSFTLSGGCATSTLPPAALALLGDDGVGPDAPRVSRTDVNGDGIDDWVADFSERLAWCGSGGCRQVVIVTRPGGAYAVAFDEQTREFKLRNSRRAAQLDIEIYGAWCGGSGVSDCRRRFNWSAEEERLVEAPNAGGETRLHGPLFQVVPATLPKELSAGLCDVQVASVPDVDGDGHRDRVGQVRSCGEQDQFRTIVWTSKSPDQFAATRADPRYEIDISTKPASLWLTPIGCATPCASGLAPWLPAAESRPANVR